MLIAQPQELAFSDLVLTFGTNVMNFDYEQFVEDTVGVSFNADDVLSTYFQSGRCSNDGQLFPKCAKCKKLVPQFIKNNQFATKKTHKKCMKTCKKKKHKIKKNSMDAAKVVAK